MPPFWSGGTGAAAARSCAGRNEQEVFMADTRGPGHRPAGQGMGTWGWVAIAAAVIVVIALVFMWAGDGTQMADTKSPTTTTQKSPTTPPAKSPTTPPANNPAPAK
jgi:hypothetical protein